MELALGCIDHVHDVATDFEMATFVNSIVALVKFYLMKSMARAKFEQTIDENVTNGHSKGSKLLV